MTLYYQQISSPTGPIHIVADDFHLRALTFNPNWEQVHDPATELIKKSNVIIEATCFQLEEYFAKRRTEFNLPILLEGTVFQKQTWRALLTIPYGETRSYSEQAMLIGNPKAVRAVGRTNGLNAIGIIVPCHRVIGKSGKLTGYAGGLEVKKYLLDLESR